MTVQIYSHECLTFSLYLEYKVVLCCQLELCVLSKYIADPTAYISMKAIKCLSFLLLTRQWSCWREAVTLLLLVFLSVWKSATHREELCWIPFSCQLCHIFSSGYIFCDYVFIIFCWLYYWEFFVQWQFLFDNCSRGSEFRDK